MSIARKALFFDVDGTLMDEETHIIPESAIRAINETRSRGNVVFINSGRTYKMLSKVRDMIPVDGILYGCGTELTFHGKSIYYYAISPEMKDRIKAASGKYGIKVNLESRDGWISCPSEKLLQEHPILRYKHEHGHKYVGKEGGLLMRDYDDDYEISKFCVDYDDGKESGHPSDIEGFHHEFDGFFTIIDRGDCFYECVPKGHGKGNAVDRMLQYLGLPADDAYAFGDSTNDIDMMRVCGNRIVLKEHDAELDVFQPYVTKAVLDDGIAYAMEKLQLI